MMLEATHTHLYPGLTGKISGLLRLADMHAGKDCLVEFSDGSVIPARISGSENSWQLYTNAYRTAAGTDIPAKIWQVRLEEEGGHLGFRILRKAPGS